jgi:hypothetical protein
MAAKLPYRNWLPESFGDVIVGHILYFDNPEDGTFTTILRSHDVFYHLPPEIGFLVSAQKPADGALVIVEYLPEGYRLAVLCEYQQSAKKQKRIQRKTAHGLPRQSK